MDGPELHARSQTLLLSGDDLGGLMSLRDYREAVAGAFRAAVEGLAVTPEPMHMPGDRGGFHVKAAAFPRGAIAARAYAAIKINGNFPGNPERHGRPTVQGVIVLSDGENGAVLALLDSIEITLQRTAAATAVAAERLARPDSARIAMLGCGAQAWPQLRALRDVLPLARGFAWDRDRRRAERLAARAGSLGVDLTVTSDLGQAARDADVIVTCTTAKSPFLRPEHVAPGVFVAAVGADWPEKNELSPELFRGATVVADSLDQALAMGDTRHAVAAGAISPRDVHAELGEIVAGRKPGRTRPDEVILFDSTGVGVQDVAAGARAYELAAQRGLGRAVVLAPSDAG
jgi:ornithine cyclodeaminase/alanine dehydrogenase-like protein (mu-crystallin family)